jgi:hypothetical protein
MANDNNFRAPHQASLNVSGNHQPATCDISDFYWSNHDISESSNPSLTRFDTGTIFPESQYAEFIESRYEESQQSFDGLNTQWPESISFREQNKVQHGRHRGKGPRTYHRSDTRIQEDINDRLCEDSFIDATDIEVHVNHGEIVLTGLVEDMTSKWRAEHIVTGVAGVKALENHLRTKVSEEQI